MEFDPGTVQRGFVSNEAYPNRDGRISFDLWRKVADDLWAWLIRYN